MSADNTAKLGLVLTGGGAKGAYHVGALQAIAELGIPIHGVAGASIGALNGAIVATANSMHQAWENLRDIWDSLADEKVIAMSPNAPAYIAMMIGMGVAFRAMPVLSSGVPIAARVAKELGFDVPGIDAELLDDSPLVRLLERFTSPEAIKQGLPLYVSVYESGGALDDILGVLKSSLRLGNTRNSDFLHVQNLRDDEMHQALMASAALPMLFRARTVEGKQYTDGGQGDWYGVGGNTPVQPLVDAGFDSIIVVHLCDGSAWDRSKYPDTNIIEVRPRNSIAQGKAAADVLGFDHQRIRCWSQQGYEDAMYCLKRVFESISRNNRLTKSRTALEQSLVQHNDLDRSLVDAMKRLT